MAHPLRAAEVRLFVSGGCHLSTLSPVVERNEPKLGLAIVDDDFVPDSVGGRHCLMRDVHGRAIAREGVGSPSVVLFSSGTTGAPKGVALTHGANFALTGDFVEATGCDSSELLYNAFALSHVNVRFTMYSRP